MDFTQPLSGGTRREEAGIRGGINILETQAKLAQNWGNNILDTQAKLSHKQLPMKVPNLLNRMFHWKYTGVFGPSLLFAGLGVAVAEKFTLAYICFAAAGTWTVAWWLFSDPLSDLRRKATRLSRSQRRNKTPAMIDAKLRRSRSIFRIAQGVGIAVIAGVTLLLEGGTYRLEQQWELRQLHGILYPANEPDPPGGCTGSSPPYRDSLKFYFGPRTGAMPYTNHLTIIKGEDGTVYLAIDRLPNGSAALTAHVTGEDGSVIINVDKNTFEINRNRILDSLSPPRPDRSTIAIKDDHGNTLTVRLLNKNSIQMAGRIHLKGKQYAVIDDNGITIYPSKLSFSSLCLGVLHSDGVALLGVD